MSSAKDHIDFDLIGKVLSAEASKQEQQQLEEWINRSEENRQEFESVRQLWEVSEPVETPQLNLDAAWKKVDAKTEENPVIPLNESRSNKRPMRMVLAIAASIALLFSIGYGYWLSNSTHQMLTAQAGAESIELTLDDGTQITLAPNTTLRYPEKLPDSERRVMLEGKGFFEVTSNPERPFIVQTNSAEVQVLGTRFEVNTESAPGELKVSVEEGRVKVTSDKLQTNEVLQAQEACTVNKSSGELNKSELDSPGAFFWKTKTIRFKRTHLTKAVEILMDLFDHEIVLEVNDMADCDITVSFVDEDIDTILEIIAATQHLELERTETGYKLQGEGCLR